MNTLSSTLQSQALTHSPAASAKLINLFGLELANISLDHAAGWLAEGAQHSDQRCVAFVNADCINKLVNNSRYRNALSQCDTLFADGVGMRIAARLQNHEFIDNVNGTDLFPVLVSELARRNLRVFLIGGKPGVAEKVQSNLKRTSPDLCVVGTQHGYVDEAESQKTLQQINSTGADVVLVAMGAPTQEIWMQTHRAQLNAKLLIGVGGLFDFYSGHVSRAPSWMRKHALEWVWRLLVQPKDKAIRYLVGNPVFLWRAWRHSKPKPQSQPRLKPKQSHQTVQIQLRRQFWKIHSQLGGYAKRTIDIVVACSAFVCLSPLLLITALMIRLESPGNVIFKQTRVGKHGKPFAMYKFRSMYTDAEARLAEIKKDNESADGVIFKLKQDPRITRVGRYIRKLSIDELPQLFNVLNGSMSLVGPRPPLPSEVAQYDTQQAYRLQCTPGITCIWQVSGRSDIPFKQQVEMDISYIQAKSLLNDVKILLKTVPAVLLARGAY